MNRLIHKMKYFPVGTILRGHGLMGEVRINPTISDLDILSDGLTLMATFPDGRVQNLNLTKVRLHGGKVLLSFEGIKDRNEADAIRGAELSIARENLPSLEEGEFYLGDLVGYTVAMEDGTVLGLVEDVWDLPANEVLRVVHNGREVLIPLIDEVLTEIDHSGRRLVISAMEGLLD
ncbi:MAG: 16S rRNA processing protein RimM [Fidelibacterota bacterium]|nr:MAG: 16S rRNA processing protein RimM [Candidatus Neomarinimicrobiota bacterium]